MCGVVRLKKGVHKRVIFKKIYRQVTFGRLLSFGQVWPRMGDESVEYGGAVSMSVKLRTDEDLTYFFHDYYDYLNLFSTGFPVLVETLTAQHHSFMS